jgi:hypothetical protein
LADAPVTQAFGDSAADLTFVPVAPCRIINTTVAGGIIAANTARNFYVNGNAAGVFEGQGGTAGGCGIPDSSTAVVINYVAVAPAGPGDFRAFPWAATPTPPLASVINYANLPGLNIANSIVQPVCNAATTTCTFDLIVQADVSAAHLVADVVGYFKAAPTNGIALAGAHIVATTATPTVTRSFTNIPGSPAITVTRLGTGTFEVGFGTNLSARFYNVVLGDANAATGQNGQVGVALRSGNANALFVATKDSAGAAADMNFFVYVF